MEESDGAVSDKQKNKAAIKDEGVSATVDDEKCPALSGLNVPLSSDFVQKQTQCDIVQWNNGVGGTKKMSVTIANDEFHGDIFGSNS